MSNIQLTAGICKRLSDPGEHAEEVLNSKPTIQILSIKKVGSTTGAAAIDRYRIIVSDGENFIQAMLATQLNKLVEESEIQKNTIAIVDKFTCNLVQDKRLLIVLDMHALAQAGAKIGSPQAIPGGEAQNTPTAAQQTPAAPQTASTSTAISTSVPSSTSSTTGQAQRAQNQGGRAGRTPSMFPIEGLSPYQNNWTIKARVTHKSEVKTWSNQRGEGKLFNVTLMDDTGEIRATGFNAVCDDLYPKLEEGKVYYISKAKVNLAKRQFSNLPNEYELSLERATEIEECRDLTNIPTIRYNFVQLSSLEELAKDAICDVIGIVKEVGEVGEITSKFNKTIIKRDITLVDRSGFSVRLTMWGKQAENFQVEGHPVIAFKGVKVNDFGGRSLTMNSSTIMENSPDIPEAHALRGWFDSLDTVPEFKSHNTYTGSTTSVEFKHSDVMSLNDVKMSDMGMSDKPEMFSARATIMHIKPENICYPACPTSGCNKKVFEQHDGWRCEKCDRSFERPEYRYIIAMAVADHSGQAWLQGFNDVGVAIFNRPADEIVEIKDRDEGKFNKIMEATAGNRFNFICRARQDTYNEQTRVRYGIQKILPLNYEDECLYQMELLASDWAQ